MIILCQNKVFTSCYFVLKHFKLQFNIISFFLFFAQSDLDEFTKIRLILPLTFQKADTFNQQTHFFAPKVSTNWRDNCICIKLFYMFQNESEKHSDDSVQKIIQNFIKFTIFLPLESININSIKLKVHKKVLLKKFVKNLNFIKTLRLLQQKS